MFEVGFSELLLIIDQFEELFTLVPDRDVTACFLNALIAAVSDPRSPPVTMLPSASRRGAYQ